MVTDGVKSPAQNAFRNHDPEGSQALLKPVSQFRILPGARTNPLGKHGFYAITPILSDPRRMPTPVRVFAGWRRAALVSRGACTPVGARWRTYRCAGACATLCRLRHRTGRRAAHTLSSRLAFPGSLRYPFRCCCCYPFFCGSHGFALFPYPYDHCCCGGRQLRWCRWLNWLRGRNGLGRSRLGGLFRRFWCWFLGGHR